jgi:hypothetical protein
MAGLRQEPTCTEPKRHNPRGHRSTAAESTSWLVASWHIRPAQSNSQILWDRALPRDAWRQAQRGATRRNHVHAFVTRTKVETRHQAVSADRIEEPRSAPHTDL